MQVECRKIETVSARVGRTQSTGESPVRTVNFYPLKTFSNIKKIYSLYDIEFGQKSTVFDVDNLSWKPGWLSWAGPVPANFSS